MRRSRGGGEPTSEPSLSNDSEAEALVRSRRSDPREQSFPRAMSETVWRLLTDVLAPTKRYKGTAISLSEQAADGHQGGLFDDGYRTHRRASRMKNALAGKGELSAERCATVRLQFGSPIMWPSVMDRRRQSLSEKRAPEVLTFDEGGKQKEPRYEASAKFGRKRPLFALARPATGLGSRQNPGELLMLKSSERTALNYCGRNPMEIQGTAATKSSPRTSTPR